MTPRWLKTRDACLYAGVCRNTLAKLIRDGALAASQINSRGDWRVDRESIDAFFGQDDQKALAILAGKRA